MGKNILYIILSFCIFSCSAREVTSDSVAYNNKIEMSENKYILINAVTSSPIKTLVEYYLYDKYADDKEKMREILNNLKPRLSDSDYHYYLSSLLFDGSDESKAAVRESLVVSHEEGHPSAGWHLYHDFYFTKKERLRFLKESASRGDSRSQFLMAGRTSNDKEKASYLFNSISQGDSSGVEQAVENQTLFTKDQMEIVLLVQALHSEDNYKIMNEINSLASKDYLCSYLDKQPELFKLIIHLESDTTNSMALSEDIFFKCKLYL